MKSKAQPKSQIPLSATSYVINLRKHLFASLDKDIFPQTPIIGTKVKEDKYSDDDLSDGSEKNSKMGESDLDYKIEVKNAEEIEIKIHTIAAQDGLEPI